MLFIPASMSDMSCSTKINSIYVPFEKIFSLKLQALYARHDHIVNLEIHKTACHIQMYNICLH